MYKSPTAVGIAKKKKRIKKSLGRVKVLFIIEKSVFLEKKKCTKSFHFGHVKSKFLI